MKPKMKPKVAIIGASGYVGGELLRLLLSHDGISIAKVTSSSNAGKQVAEVHRNLNGLTDLRFSDEPAEEIAESVDVVFFALPHCTSMQIIPRIIGNAGIKAGIKARIIDMSADYRLDDVKEFEKFYGIRHASPGLLKKFACGLPEINREEIRKAKNVAVPGCFPTGTLLSLMPLAKSNLLNGNIIVDAKTGSSGSGKAPSEGTHHPERAQDFRAYNVFSHRHQPEIEQGLRQFSKKGFDLTFVTHSAPMVRGIFTTAYAFLEKDISREELENIYKKYYEKEFFVRLVRQARSNVVKGTNFCDISLECSGRKVVVTSAIDNLVKGAAGTAVQDMNLMLGLRETKALEFPGFYP